MSGRGRTEFNERQLLGILHRQHAQHHRIDQTEYRRVRANTEREGEQRNRCDDRRFADDAKCVTNVL